MSDTKKSKLEELEEKKAQLLELELQERLESIEDRKQARADRAMKEQEKHMKYQLRSNQLADDDAKQIARELGCNHHKGGQDGAPGDSDKYSVIKHQFSDGSWWVRCSRCGKTWKPVDKEQFTLNGKFDVEKHTLAVMEYKQAMAYPTTNKSSGSYLFGGEGFQERYREALKNTDLR